VHRESNFYTLKTDIRSIDFDKNKANMAVTIVNNNKITIPGQPE